MTDIAIGEAAEALVRCTVKLPGGKIVTAKPLLFAKALDYMEKFDRYRTACLWTPDPAKPDDKGPNMDEVQRETLVAMAKEFPGLVDIQPPEALNALTFAELMSTVRSFFTLQRDYAVMEPRADPKTPPPAST